MKRKEGKKENEHETSFMRKATLTGFIFLFVFQVFLNAQITSVGHSARIATTYSLDTTLMNDTLWVDTLFFKTNKIYIDSVTGPSYLLPSSTDTIRSADSAYNLRENVYFALTYYHVIRDTIFFTYYHLSDSDYIYVYNINDYTLQKGHLQCNASDTATIIWYMYNPGTKQYDSLLASFTNVTSSELDSLPSGGYKTVIQGKTDTVSYHAWVFNNYFSATLNPTDKNNDGFIDDNKKNCKFTDIDYTLTLWDFRYYDRKTGAEIYLRNDSSISVASDKDEPLFNVNNYTIRIRPPQGPDDEGGLENEYTVTIMDKFGHQMDGAIKYKTILPKSDFKLFIRDSHNEDSWEDVEEGVTESAEGYSSPARVLFVDTSYNAVRWDWYFGDSLPSTPYAISIGADTSQYDTFHIYYYPGTYGVKLITYSNENCEDEYELGDPLIIKPSKLEAANFFTPNGDGQNDVFMIFNESLLYFEIQIFTRWGKKVYEYSGDINSWGGWDGKVKESNRDAVPGLYYYVVKGTGWEYDPPTYYEGKEYTGFLYLYR